MKLRTLVITVVVLAVLSVAAYLTKRPEPAPSTDLRVGKPVLDSDTAAKAASLSLSDQGKKVELARNSDATWKVVSYYDLPADFEKISRFVQDLNEAKIDRFVTANPGRLARLEFKDSKIILADASGKAFWSLTLGKNADTGNGRFLRYDDEPQAYFSGLHVWLDTDAKGWANAQLVSLKPDEVAKVEIPIEGSSPVVATRAKKDAPWEAQGAPAGKKLNTEQVTQVLSTLTSLRFSETVDPKDPAAAEAAQHMRTYRLTGFDGKTLTIAIGRKPEEKRLKPPVPEKKDVLAPVGTATEVKPDAKPVTPEFETIPAGPVFVVVASSDSHAAVNVLMKRRAFETDDYTFTRLPQKADDVFQAEKAK
jgi:hypothetical protein